MENVEDPAGCDIFGPPGARHCPVLDSALEVECKLEAELVDIDVACDLVTRLTAAQQLRERVPNDDLVPTFSTSRACSAK